MSVSIVGDFEGQGGGAGDVEGRAFFSRPDQGSFGEGWTDDRICSGVGNQPNDGRPGAPPVGGTRGDGGAHSQEAQDPADPSIFDGQAQARLIALACSTPPPGHARWSIRLLADKVVELKIVERAHFNTVGRALKKTISSRI